MPPPLNVRPREASARTCTYCREALDAGDLPTVECRGCRVVLHVECREESPQCPSIGCPGLWADRITAPGSDAERFFGTVVGPARSGVALLRRLGGAAIALILLLGVVLLGAREQYRLRQAEQAQSAEGDIDWLIRKLESRHPADRAAARVGLISLEPESLSRLVNPLAQTRGWARQEAVRILRSKMTSRTALNDLIHELNTTNRATITLVIEVLKTRPLPTFGVAEVTALIQALDGRDEPLIAILQTQEVPNQTIEAALGDALVSDATLTALQAYAASTR